VTNVDSNPEARRIDDYLRGRLSEDQTRQFELRMLEDDVLFAEVQRVELLRTGLARLPDKPKEPAPSEVMPSGQREAPWLLQWLQPALGAVLLLAVVALGIGNSSLRQQLEQAQAPRTGIPVITLHDQRALFPGMAGDAIDSEARDGPVLVEFDVSAHQQQAFRVEIRSARDTTIHERVVPDARGYLTVYLPDGQTSVAVSTERGEVLRRFGTE